MFSVILDENTYLKILEDFKDIEVPTSEDYVIHLFEDENILIKIYQDKKQQKKAVFAKRNAEFVAISYGYEPKEEIKKEEELPAEYLNIEDQIGSDEVGVGDVVLPLIVVASYIKKQDIKILKKYNIKDSKSLGDKQILEVIPKIINNFKFVKYTIDNEKFNTLLKQGYNNNSIKAKYHNLALYQLEEKYQTHNCYIDQFVNENKYYDYLKNEKVILNDLVFSTNGELYYPSIALSSCVARYFLLKEKEKLEEKYDMEFPFGSGIKADTFIKEFIEKYSKEELYKIAKANFNNVKTYLSDDNTLLK